MLQFEQKFEFDCVARYLSEDPYNVIVAIDDKGRIIYCNDVYLRMVGAAREQAIGKYILDVAPHTRMINVLITGIPERGYVFVANGRETIAQSFPVRKDGHIIGVVGRSLFLEIDDARDFANMVNSLDHDIQSARNKVQESLIKNFSFDNIIGKSPNILKLKTFAQAVAKNECTVLMTGESGTGKDWFAKAIHSSSKRSSHPFVRINCAAIPEQLIESELFGYEAGTFTGARKGGKKGKFELANNGTIFLDEIGELPLSMQAKLLTVLQEKEIDRLGSEHNPVKLDVRIIAATNQNLIRKVEEGTFRKDLYYRINVIELEIPPLRQRGNDINLLIEYFIKKLSSRLELKITSINSDARHILSQYQWPGNVRELEHTIERAILLASLDNSRTIKPSHISDLIAKSALAATTYSNDESYNLKDYLDQCEKNLIIDVLAKTHGKKYLAAKILNIHPSALYRKIEKYGL